ncbi:hypothetical protein L798_04884 [Zootermopsis nevadensis]|uniref:Uncharacterized protein n=1 Tax=Zootermopsis nevadensis TaxID=136037 RepID=A0A067R9Y1_ZOONE|nr:hypothetical protein L798_04884 [Zootermopsis nevadensis]
MFLLTRLHGATTLKTLIFRLTAVKTSNPTLEFPSEPKQQNISARTLTLSLQVSQVGKMAALKSKRANQAKSFSPRTSTSSNSPLKKSRPSTASKFSLEYAHPRYS